MGSTKKGYDFPTAAYHLFCKIYNLEPLEKDKEVLYLQLERYSVWRLEYLQGTGGTTKSDIDAIQHYLALNGINSNIKKEYKPWKKIAKAATINNPSKEQAKRPLKSWEINKILGLLPPNAIDTIVIRAVWAFALSTALRADEYLAKTQNDGKLQKLLYVRKDRVYIWEPKLHKTNRKHFGMVWYYKTKINQTLKRETAILPCRCDKGFCPITELNNLLKILKKSKNNTALFTWADGTYVTQGQTRTILQNCISEIGSINHDVGNHSWKKTCVTEAITDGLPDSVIVQIAHWKSFNSMRPYINMEPRELAEKRANTRDYISSNIEKTRFRRFTTKPTN